MSVPFIHSSANGREEITVFFNNQSKTVIKGQHPYDLIRSAVQRGADEQEIGSIFDDEAPSVVDVLDDVVKFRNVSVVFEDNTLSNLSFNKDGDLLVGKWNGPQVKVDDSLANELVKVLDDSMPHNGMVKFIQSLYASAISDEGARVTEAVRSQLLNFIQRNGLTVNSEGELIAYKAVTHNYWDKHTGKTFQNLPGTIVSMPYDSVDSNPRSHCSRGLHAGSLEYISTFGSGNDRIVIVVITPSDVVSVPEDCQCRKLRCCKYRVVGNYEGELRQTVYDTVDDVDAMYDADEQGGFSWEYDDDEDDGWDEYDSELDDDDEDCCPEGCCVGEDDGDRFDGSVVEVFIDALQDFNKAVKEKNESIKEKKPVDDNVPYHNVRDSHGRFTKPT